MKILIVASFPDSIVSFRGHLIKSLIGQGLEVIVAAPGLTDGSAAREKVEGIGAVAVDIPLDRAGLNPFRDIGLLYCLYRLMRNHRPRMVLGYTIKPVLYGITAAWLSRVPRRYALVTGLGYAFTSARAGALAGVVRKMYRFALWKADKVFFQNPDDQALFLRESILSDKTPSVVVNGSGVDLEEFSVHTPPLQPIRFLMIARLLGDKGVREYVDAARKVKAHHGDARFRLVGWIDENPEAVAEAELEAWTNEGLIEYLGRLDDVRPAIADCSVYVLPSYREGTPRTSLEAMAMGRPIITTDVPGCRETVKHHYNGDLVPVRSVDALADAMTRYIESPDLVIDYGRRSRQIAEQKYDVRMISQAMIDEMELDDES